MINQLQNQRLQQQLRLRLLRLRPLQLPPLQLRPPQLRSLQLRSLQLRAVQLQPVQLRAVRLRAVQLRVVRLRAVQRQAVRLRVVQVRAVRLQPAQLQPVQLRPVQLRAVPQVVRQQERLQQLQRLLLQAAIHVSNNYCWNQTGVAVADTSSNPLSDPRCLYIDANDTFYVCAHNLGYVQKWAQNTTTRTAATNIYSDHIDSVIWDKNGYMYTNDHDVDKVRRYPPGSLSDTIIVGTGSSVTGTLKHPAGLAIDDNLNLYIADQDNDRIAKWSQNSSSVVTAINTASVIGKPSKLLFAPGSWDQIYISDEEGIGVYLWKFNSSGPSVNYTKVNDNTTLKKPRGMRLDQYGNLYVADYENSRVVMYCVNSTVGTVVVDYSNLKTVDLDFDSHMNLYVIVDSGKVLKHALL